MLLIKATDYRRRGGTEAVNTLVRRSDGAGGGPALPQSQGTIGAMDKVPMDRQAGSGPAAEPGGWLRDPPCAPCDQTLGAPLAEPPSADVPVFHSQPLLSTSSMRQAWGPPLPPKRITGSFGAFQNTRRLPGRQKQRQGPWVWGTCGNCGRKSSSPSPEVSGQFPAGCARTPHTDLFRPSPLDPHRPHPQTPVESSGSTRINFVVPAEQ